MNDDKIPFELSNNGLTLWLNSISQLNAANIADQLNRVLKQIKHCDTDSTIVLPLLIRLTPTVFHATTTLKNVLLNPVNEQAKEQQPKLPKLGIQLLRSLCLTFSHFLEKNQLSTEQQLLAAFYALQSAGFCFYLSALFHEPPSNTLWTKSAELYWSFANKNLQHQPLTTKFSEFKYQTTLEEVIKRNLLFAIASPYRCTSNEIVQLFQWTNQQFYLLELKSEPVVTTSLVWDLNTGQPYISTQAAQSSRYKLISLETDKLLPQLEVNNTHLPTHLCCHLSLQWSGYKDIIGRPVGSISHIAMLLTGFDYACDYLQKHAKLNKIRQLSNYTPSKLPSKISLIPLEKEKNLFESYDKQLSYLKKVQLFDTQDRLFVIAKVTPGHYPIGDLVLILYEDESYVIGVNRQQIIHPSLGLTHLLIEKITTSAECFTHQDKTIIGNHFIVNNRQEALLPQEKINVGQKIHCENNQTVTVDSLREFTPFFARFKISFDS